MSSNAAKDQPPAEAPPVAPAPRFALTRFEWACLAVVAFAFALRAWFVLHPGFIWDSAWLLMLGRSFSEDGTFWLRWTEDPRGYSGYWPPLYPIYVSGFVRVFGPSYHTLALAAVTASALLTATTFLTTRQMFGRTRAFALAALVAASPAFMSSDARGMSESLLALMVVLTVWAFLKGLDKPIWLPIAAGFGLLAYLGKANLGIPFVVAGLVGVGVWLGIVRGWRRTFGNPLLIGSGVALVAVIALMGATRTGKLGGVGLGLIEPITKAISHPMWVPLFLFKLLFAVSFLAVVALPFSLFIRKAFRREPGQSWVAAMRARPREATLVMAVALPILATAVFTASFLITEDRGPTQFQNVADAFRDRGFLAGLDEVAFTAALLVDFDNIRYLTPAIVPFLWLAVPHYPFEADVPNRANIEARDVRRRHEWAFGAAVALYALLLWWNPLGGRATLDGLYTFLFLSTIPLLVALVARRQTYAVSERKLLKNVTAWRYVPGEPRPVRWGVVGALLLVGALLAYAASSWFAFVGIGLLIAACSQSARGTAVALALFLLLSTASNINTPLPVHEASEYMAENLPEGTVVAMIDPAVYVAAVAPDNVKMRISNMTPIEDDVDALLAVGNEGWAEYPGFTPVERWYYEYEFYPALQTRLWFEKTFLGHKFATQDQLGLTLFLRNNATAPPP